MAEWSKAADSKSVIPFWYRGFESSPLRHIIHIRADEIISRLKISFINILKRYMQTILLRVRETKHDRKAPVAQWIEHLTTNQGAAGSTPAGRATFLI